MKHLSLVLISSLALMFAACGDSGNATSGLQKTSNANMEVRTYSELPSCAEKREGKTAYVADQEQGYICSNGKWVEDDDVRIVEYPSSSSRSKVTVPAKVSSSSFKLSSSSVAQRVVDPSTVVKGSFTDSRDGQSYKTVTIGSQTWMAENLNYKTDKSYCYGDVESNCSKYGRLYWCEVDLPERETPCPSGWHLPTKAEFETLLSAVGGESTAGAKLKSTSGWSNSGNGTDAYSFSALPAGFWNYIWGYSREGGSAYFLSSSVGNPTPLPYFMYLNDDSDEASLSAWTRDNSFSVRCVKD